MQFPKHSYHTMHHPHLDKFTEETSQCQGFLLQSSLYFMGKISIMDQQKIAQFLNLLTTNTQIGYGRMGARWGLTLSFCKQFVEMFCRVFDHAPKGKEIREQLLAIKQGWRHVADYALQFCTLAAGTIWLSRMPFSSD